MHDAIEAHETNQADFLNYKNEKTCNSYYSSKNVFNQIAGQGLKTVGWQTYDLAYISACFTLSTCR
jgi:hypothetical protein